MKCNLFNNWQTFIFGIQDLHILQCHLPAFPTVNLKFMGMTNTNDLWTVSHSQMTAVIL